MRIAAIVFAATMVGLGAWGLVDHDFAPIWRPVPRHFTAREGLVWLTGLAALAGGLGLLWRRSATLAGGVLAALLLVWMLVFKVPAVVAAPAVAVTWESAGETAAIAAGAWALFATLARARGPLALVAGDVGLRGARILYALAMLAFGAAHLAYVKATAALVPAWLPDHVAWVWITGVAYIAAGLAMLVGAWARFAATLSALQMGLFTLLVWASALLRGHASADDWSEAVVSWSLTAAGWVVAASYAGAPWLAVGGRRSR